MEEKKNSDQGKEREKSEKRKKGKELPVIQDFYSQRAIAHAGFLVVSMFGLFTLLALLRNGVDKGSFSSIVWSWDLLWSWIYAWNSRLLVALSISYWLVWLYGLYSYLSFSFYASVAQLALEKTTKYDSKLIDKAKNRHNGIIKWFFDFKKGKHAKEPPDLKYKIRDKTLTIFLIVYLLIGLLPFLALII